MSQEGGTKHDQGKPDLSYVSYELVEAIARVRDFGAKKYTKYGECNCVKSVQLDHDPTCNALKIVSPGRNNWKKGFLVTRSCAAALRHIFLFLSGETNDEESGLSHLAHAICDLEHAVYDMKYRPENDDR